MAFDRLKILGIALRHLFPLAAQLLFRKLKGAIHPWTYKALPTAKNVVVVGGNFAGLCLTQRLCQSLPTGYRVIMVEKNSHFNFSWVFPRFSVITGYEDRAFIPYDGLEAGAAKGILRRVQAEVTDLTPTHVLLSSGEVIEYAYLVIATGTSATMPAKVLATDAGEGCAEFRGVQESIRDAQRIAVIGGGAVGVELASDIKSFFPDKNISLYHSRAQLLPTFGHRLHDHVAKALEALGIRVVYQQRPEILPGGKTLRTSRGEEEYDLILPCTGQRPNSSLLKNLAPDAISETTNHILVKPTLQIQDSAFENIFAFGDVVETGGPKMSRAAQFQAEVVLANILRMIDGKQSTVVYKPLPYIEGAIKLTLGKSAYAVYAQDNEKDVLDFGNGGDEDLGVLRAWRMLGARYIK
ncbi:oxidoreductase [Roridomyces roridus]|uniref:Oxidoreductase n=1 Tax=Roridomyces roridus TaxID=1738132 RepID=A0AAD7BF03_9AGAR|nr:oxidoreductase [Roridomyces roridus]